MTSTRGCLLVVDDEEMNRDMLGRRLEAEGFQVVLAEGGAEALRALASGQHFDGVLLDVMMPGQNGYEVLAEIRKSQSVLELPVILVTARTQSEDMVNAFEAGANDYITKPINFPVALARIASHVASKRMSAQLRDSETRYALSAQGANDGLWDWNLQTGRVHFSDRWKQMLGYETGDISDSPEEWFDRIHPDDRPHVQAALAAHRAHEVEQFQSEHRMLRKDQTYCWVLTRGMAIWDAAGQEVRMAGSQTDITRGKAADPLTGLPNRVLLIDHLEDAIKHAQQHPGYLFAVLFVDLDRFKIVNDSLGHHAGDELLVAIAKRLEASLRGSDVVSRMTDRYTVARFGGDEFVLLLKGLHGPENASQVADRILEVVTQPIPLQEHTVSVSASIGIAIGSQLTDSSEGLLRDADTAMYQAKAAGKSRWCVFDESMRQRAIERLLLENDLKQGLDRGEFRVFYQPIVSLSSGRLEGFEALLRWQHATRGLVSPMEFIPIAEETGFIVELGVWVLEQSLRQLHSLQVDYPDLPPLFMSVNVSGMQLADPTFVSRVARALELTGVPATQLKLEITETAIMSHPELAMTMVKQLRALGVRISLDDFGTGHSSLSYLQQFQIDTLKIDRSFVARMSESPQGEEIVQTIIRLAHSLGMEVTAEGIEEQAHHAALKEFSCEAGQGYLYSRPIAAAALRDLLTATEGNIVRSAASMPAPLMPVPAQMALAKPLPT